MTEEVSDLMRHRVTKPLEVFIIQMPAWPQRGVDRDRALLYFGPHLDNGIFRFRARHSFVVGIGKLMSTRQNRRCAAFWDAMPVPLGEPQRQRHGIRGWVPYRLVSSSRCGQEQRRREDDREQQTSHALHAEDSRGMVLSSCGVILGVVVGEREG